MTSSLASLPNAQNSFPYAKPMIKISGVAKTREKEARLLSAPDVVWLYTHFCSKASSTKRDAIPIVVYRIGKSIREVNENSMIMPDLLQNSMQESKQAGLRMEMMRMRMLTLLPCGMMPLKKRGTATSLYGLYICRR
jgi:hypothetical protein